MHFISTTNPTTCTVHVHTMLLHSANTAVDPFGTFVLLRKLRALSLHIRHRIRGTLGIIRFLGGRPGIITIGRPSLPRRPSRTLCKGCFPGKNNSVFAFRIQNNIGRTRAFVSDLRVFSLLTGITSIGSLIVRPTAAARSRLDTQRLRRRNVGPNAIHLSVKARRVSSLLSSLSRTFSEVWGGGDVQWGRCYYVVIKEYERLHNNASPLQAELPSFSVLCRGERKQYQLCKLLYKEKCKSNFYRYPTL